MTSLVPFGIVVIVGYCKCRHWVPIPSMDPDVLLTSLVYDVVYAIEFHQTDAMYSLLHVSNDQGRCQRAPPEGPEHPKVGHLPLQHTTHVLSGRVQDLQAVIVGVRHHNKPVSVRGHSMHPYLPPTPWRSPPSYPFLLTGLQAARVQAPFL